MGIGLYVLCTYAVSTDNRRSFTLVVSTLVSGTGNKIQGTRRHEISHFTEIRRLFWYNLVGSTYSSGVLLYRNHRPGTLCSFSTVHCFRFLRRLYRMYCSTVICLFSPSSIPRDQRQESWQEHYRTCRGRRAKNPVSTTVSSLQVSFTVHFYCVRFLDSALGTQHCSRSASLLAWFSAL